jgi:hypothetical protein
VLSGITAWLNSGTGETPSQLCYFLQTAPVSSGGAAACPCLPAPVPQVQVHPDMGGVLPRGAGVALS